MYLDNSASMVSCGVNELSGFENLNPKTRMPRLLTIVLAAMRDEYYGAPRATTACTYVFSDVQRELGDRFGKWLMRKNFGSVVKVRARNFNSGNKIATYLWVPDVEKLKVLPEWEKARKLRQQAEWNDDWF